LLDIMNNMNPAAIARINRINEYYRIINKLQEHRLNGKCCDVILKTNGRNFPCHRNVLMSHSQYFFSIFMVDNDIKDTSIVISLESVSMVAMKIILESFYSVERAQIVPETAMEDVGYAVSIMHLKLTFVGIVADFGSLVIFSKM